MRHGEGAIAALALVVGLTGAMIGLVRATRAEAEARREAAAKKSEATEAKEKLNDEEGDVHGAWAYMQLFVKERLKSPKTAEFPFGGYRHVTPLGGYRYKVDSYVDSQNPLGAQTRTKFEGVIKDLNGSWELEYLNFK